MASVTKTEFLYNDILTSLGCEVYNNGAIYAHNNTGEEVPVKIDGKQLVIPTRENINQLPAYWDSNIAFHPLPENVFGDESKVSRKLRKIVEYRITSVISFLLVSLAELTVNRDIILDPKQALVHDILKYADEKTVSYISSIISAAGGSNRSLRLFSTNLVSGGDHAGQRWNKLAIAHFPIFDYVDSKHRKILGVKGRVNDFDAIPKLFEYILPDSSVAGTYCYGSNNDVATGLDAIMGSYLSIAKRLNEVIELYSDVLGDVVSGDFKPIDLSWTDSMYGSDLSIMVTEIPPLNGNKSMIAKQTKIKETKGTSKMTNATNATDVTDVSVKPGKDGKVSWGSIVASRKAVDNVETKSSRFGQSQGGFGQRQGGFGQNQGGFGQQNQGGFGQQNQGGFGQQNQGGMGMGQGMNQNQGGFGNQNQGGMGMGQGMNQNQGGMGMGQGMNQNQGGFGQQNQGGFGQQNQGGMGMGQGMNQNQGGMGMGQGMNQNQGGFGQQNQGGMGMGQGMNQNQGGFGNQNQGGMGMGQGMNQNQSSNPAHGFRQNNPVMMGGQQGHNPNIAMNNNQMGQRGHIAHSGGMGMGQGMNQSHSAMGHNSRGEAILYP